MKTCPLFCGDEILPEVKSALQKLQGNTERPVTIQVVDDSIVITPVRELQPGEELDRIKAELHAEFGETFKALSQ